MAWPGTIRHTGNDKRRAACRPVDSSAQQPKAGPATRSNGFFHSRAPHADFYYHLNAPDRARLACWRAESVASSGGRVWGTRRN